MFVQSETLQHNTIALYNANILTSDNLKKTAKTNVDEETITISNENEHTSNSMYPM